MPIKQERMIALADAGNYLVERIEQVRRANRDDDLDGAIANANQVLGQIDPKSILHTTISALVASAILRYNLIRDELEIPFAISAAIAAEQNHFTKNAKLNDIKRTHQKIARMKTAMESERLQAEIQAVPALLAEANQPPPTAWAAPSVEYKRVAVRETPEELERLRAERNAKPFYHPDDVPLGSVVNIGPGIKAAPKPKSEAKTPQAPQAAYDDDGVKRTLPPMDELYAPPPAGPVL